jgi:hypothetical protein
MIVLKSQNGFVTQDQRAQFERWGVDIIPITSATVRLLGGTPEINGRITELSQLVSLSKNYKLHEKLKTYFSELTSEAIRDGQIGQGLALPEACRAKLGEISALVRTALASSESNRGADAEQVPNQAAFIDALQQTFRTAFPSVRATPFSERATPFLDAFLETDPILRWANETTLEFFNYLDLGQEVKVFVEDKLTDADWTAVDAALDATVGYDIDSVLAEIITESLRIVTVIDHIQQFRSNATFFDGKGVSIRDGQSRIIKEGVIKSAEMGALDRTSQTLTLNLTDDTKISLTLIHEGAAISQAAYQTIEQRTLFHHLDMSENHNTASTIYRIKTGVTLAHLRDCLPDGNYRLTVSEEAEPRMLRQPIRFKRITFTPQDAGVPAREFKYYYAENPVRLNLEPVHLEVTGPMVEMVFRSIGMKKVDNQHYPFTGDVFKRAIRISPDVDESYMHIQMMKRQTEYREQLLFILTADQNLPILRNLSEIAMSSPEWESKPEIGAAISRLTDQPGVSWRTTIEALFSLEPSPPTQEHRQAEIGSLLKEGFYRHFVRNALSEKVASLLGLIADTGMAIHAMRNKTAIVYLGNTGSGKSTLVSQHLGFKIAFRPSSYGGQRAEVDDTSGDPRPGIGHSIARSETLYASAYPIRPSARRHLASIPDLDDVVLVDFPGFSDTRGTDYEICTSLSTDQTIRTLGNNVKAYVIVMQYSDFEGRGTGLVKLMSDLNSRFPHMLDPEADISPFHIFINKVPADISPQHIETRISRGKADVAGTGGLASLAWNFLDRMYASQGKVSMLNLENRRQRDTFLLQKLRGADFNLAALRSVIYKGSFSNRNTDYANTMKEISDSWQDRILKPYLDTMPREIDHLTLSLTGDTTRRDSVTLEKADLEGELTRSETELSVCQSILSEFAPGEVIELDALNPLVAARVRTQLSAQLANLNAQLVTQMAAVSASRSRVETLTTEQRAAQTALRAINVRIEDNLREIPILSAGISEKTFVEWRPRPEDRYSGTREWLPGRRDALLDSTEEAQSGRDYVDSDGTSGTWGTYRGKSAIQDHLIRSDYNILPTDPTLIDQLQRLLRDAEVTLGEIQVKMDSRNTAVVGVSSPTGAGNLVRYQLEYTFDGNPANMPYCHIFHRIPNYEINRAHILQRRGQLESDNASRARVVADETTVSANLRAENQRLEGYVLSQRQTEQEIAQQTGAAVRDALTDRITYLETRMSEIPTNISDKEQEIESLNHQIADKTDRRSTLIHEKKLLGFVIRQRREQLRQIVNMMDIMVGDGVSEADAASNPIDRTISSIIESCRAFTHYYGEQERRLDESLREDG